jgi:nucleoside-diphosphate-sugar epimerase
MKLLVTGATGFLGQYVVASAIERGHQVRAVVRPASAALPAAWAGDPRIQPVRGDLRRASDIPPMLEGVDAVIHLAAAKAGDLFDQFASTVVATENLLGAMDKAHTERLVLTSSFSVYEYQNRPSWSVLDEDSPLAAVPRERDEYCQTKLVQEALARGACRQAGRRCIVLRPGVIFGPGNVWTARLGMQLGSRWWLRTGARAPLPLTYVENCADAIVAAAEYSGAERDLVLNVVDDETPSQRQYMDELRRASSSKARIIGVPWPVMQAAAGLASLVNRTAFGGTAKVPAIFRPAALAARCRPLRYDGSRIRAALGWSPRLDWREGLQRSVNPLPAQGGVESVPP